MAGSGSTDQLVRADISYRPPSNTFRSSIPRNLNNQVYFVRQVSTFLFTNQTNQNTENNFFFTATGNLLQASQYLTIFDQYYCANGVITLTNLGNQSAADAILPCITAIDYDSTANIGANLQQFGTAVVSALSPGDSVTRVISPTVKPTVGSTQADSVSRIWCDSGARDIPFYGIRTLCTPSNPNVNCSITFSLTWAFRNNI